jgi:protein tyrosine phosphatase
MIWETPISHVVLLSKWIENGKLVADNYLPEKAPKKLSLFESPEGEANSVNLTVSSLSLDENGPFETRVLELAKVQEKKTLRHYFVKDFASLSAEQILNVQDKIEEDLKKNNVDTNLPTLIICSNGSERSGLWILASHLRETVPDLASNEILAVNIMKIVDSLRSQRMNAICSAEQYQTAYHVLLHLLKQMDK